jgi:hypothetical protein
MVGTVRLSEQVRLTEFPYFWTDVWRKIGQKGNALREVLWMRVVVVSPEEHPGIG